MHIIQTASGKLCLNKSFKKLGQAFQRIFTSSAGGKISQYIWEGKLVPWKPTVQTYQETDNQCAYNRGHDTFDNKRHTSSQQQS